MSREMKDSGVEWIGEIPEDWEIIPNKHLMKKVKDLCSVYNGEDILSLSMKGVYVRDPDDESGKRPTTYNGYQHVQEGNLLMCLFDIDVTPRCVGRVYNNGLTSPAYSRFVMNETRAIVDYYYYYYLALDFDKTLLHLSKNMRSSLTESDFGSINAPVPSPTEQQQIVHFLDRKCTAIDTAIEKTKKSIEKLEEYKKAVITKAVTKGIDPNAKMKDSGVEWIGEIPEGMDIIRIKFISDIFGRIGFRGYTQDDLVNEGDGAISLSPSNLKSFRMSYDKCTYISWSKYEESPEIKIENGDILFVKTGSSYGKSCIVKDLPEKATINPQLIVFKNIKCNNKYLFYLLQTWIVDTQTQWYVTGGTIPTMSQDKIANFYLPYYKGNYKQQQIVHFLDRKCTAIDTAIEKKKKAIEKWEEYKKSLIYYTVTGKIDCRGEEL